MKRMIEISDFKNWGKSEWLGLAIFVVIGIITTVYP